jgi:biotin carboxyl carrier protein
MADPVSGQSVAERAVPATGSGEGISSADQVPDGACRAWLESMVGGIQGARRAVLLLGSPDAGPYSPAAFWPEGQGPTDLLAELAKRTLDARRGLVLSRSGTAGISSPLMIDGQLHGLAAVELDPRAEPALQTLLERLAWSLRALEADLRATTAAQDSALRERLISTLDLLATSLSEHEFPAAARALATDLAVRLDCDRVSIGFQKRDHVEVVAVSHSAEFGQRMNLTRAIGAAMDEAVDQRSVITIPAGKASPLVTRDHDALARLFGSGCVLTIPFQTGERQTGAFTLERPSDRPFDPATIELCQATVALTSRILEAKRLNDRHLPKRLADAVRDHAVKLIGPRHYGRKLAALASLGLVLFFSVATWDYRIGAKASLEGSVRRVLIAPIDGYVASARHRAGDVVKAGTILASLDQRDLQLELLKWQSQRSQFSRQYQEAVAKYDRAQASIVLAQVQQAEAQVNLLAEQLQRTQIASPFEGLVVSGDLHQSLGAAVKRGQVLFEVSPLDGYRVVLEVAETAIANIRVGQRGRLLLSSLPGEQYDLSISTVTPVVLSKEGRSYFRVEAILERPSERLRPGMEGVAKIEAGERRLIWVITHRFIDWLRLLVWSWM